MENKAAGSNLVEDAQRKRIRKSWLLSTPALMVLASAASGPLLIVLVYSFISSGEYGGVVWKFSTDAWFNVVFHRDIFDGTLALADAHLIILWRSIKLSFFTTVTTLAIGFPTAYFIATRPRKTRNIWLFLITIPFWTNLLIRTFAILEVIRNEGLINIGLQNIWGHRWTDPDALHRFRNYGRYDVCLSAPDGIAVICIHGAAGL